MPSCRVPAPTRGRLRRGTERDASGRSWVEPPSKSSLRTQAQVQGNERSLVRFLGPRLLRRFAKYSTDVSPGRNTAQFAAAVNLSRNRPALPGEPAGQISRRLLRHAVLFHHAVIFLHAVVLLHGILGHRVL